MRVFKTTYTTRDGTKRQTKKWFIEVRDHLRIPRRFYAFTDKSYSEALGRQIDRLVACKISGAPLDPQLHEWLEHLPVQWSEKLAAIGLIDRSRVAAGKPLRQHVEDFETYLTKTKSPRTGWHRKPDTVLKTIRRIKRVFSQCGFRFWSDIDCSRVELYLGEHVVDPKTHNGYVTVLRQFANWMVIQGRAGTSPLERLQRLAVKRRPNTRGALTSEEVMRLLPATEKAPFRFGMSGHERAVLYLFVMETGLRSPELRSLKVSSFDFDRHHVAVAAEFCKNGQEAVQLLKHVRGEQFRQFFRGKLPQAQAFNVPSTYRMAPMLRADCRDAGIEVVNEWGKIVFYSLRHTLATNLDRTGASLKERMAIMRHSDRSSLTLGVYTHLTTYDIRRAVERLPDYPWPGTEATSNTLARVSGGGVKPAKQSGRAAFARGREDTRFAG